MMSKMGISIICSYRGGYNFEAVGLSRSLCREYFPGTDHPHLRHRPQRHQEEGARAARPRLCRGRAAARRSAASTATAAAARPTRWKRKVIHQLQHAVATDSYHAYKQFAEHAAGAGRRSRSATCSTSTASSRRSPLDEVESITEISKRFVTPGMSLGALGPEAHETLTIAMNRIGAKLRLRRGRRGHGALHSRAPTATTPTRRSSRWPRAASA